MEAAGLDIDLNVSANGAPALSLPIGLSASGSQRASPTERRTIQKTARASWSTWTATVPTTRLATSADQIRINVTGDCVGYPCDDGNECTVDTCDHLNAGSCSYTNVVDGTSCAVGFCVSGVCEQNLSFWDPPDRDLSSRGSRGAGLCSVGSGSTFELDFYRNPAYECGLSGNYTFLVIEPRDNPGGEAPLWVYLHGGGVGYYDDQGVYHATRTQTEDTWNHEESLEDLRDFRLPIGGNGQLLDNTRGRRLAEGYRLLIVSMCDHDLYGGLGTPYPNNPNPGAEVNGLEATMAAVEYTVANYPTTACLRARHQCGVERCLLPVLQLCGRGGVAHGRDHGLHLPNTPLLSALRCVRRGAGLHPPGPGLRHQRRVRKDRVLRQCRPRHPYRGAGERRIHRRATPRHGGRRGSILWRKPSLRSPKPRPPGSTTATGTTTVSVKRSPRSRTRRTRSRSSTASATCPRTTWAPAAASDIVDTFVGGILAANPPQPFIKGLESLFIGHSFFRPVAQGLPFHTTQAAISVHSQSVVSAGGANGAPEALWNDPDKRATIQGIPRRREQWSSSA